MIDHILSAIVLTPLIASMILLAMPAKNGVAIRFVALIGAALTLPASIWLCFAYDRSIGGFQFEEIMSWVPTLGIGYHLGVDGTSVVLVLLTSVIITGGV